MVAPAPVVTPAPLAPAPPPFALPPQPALTPMPAPPPAPPLVQAGQTVAVHQHKRQRVEATTSQPVVQIPIVASNTPIGTVIDGNGHVMSQILAPRGGRQKSQAQIDRRRERNRILARRTRLRKKFFFESLQKDVTDLQKENMVLKEIVRTKIDPSIAKSILDSCKANEELPRVVAEHCGDPSSLDRQDFNLIQSIQKSQQCFVITDPSLQDNPIVYASDDFLSLTGYAREDVLGRNCRFLQGTETSPAKVAQIRKALSMGEDVSVTFINYTADGTAFWNKLFIAALRDAQNNIVNFIGITVKVAGPESGDPESGKALPGETASNGMESQNNGEDGYLNAADGTVDADAAVMAIEGAVTAAVAAAPKVVKKSTKSRS